MFNIMVVEDDFNVRKLMYTVLKQHGYEPVLAKDGLDALEQLDKISVDLIIVDIMMPRMDGYEFIETLRVSGWDIPIIIVSAKESFDSKKKAFLLGTDDYMVKPVNEEELILRIAALLRRAHISNEHKLTIGSTTLNYDSQTISTSTSEYCIPKKEFLLLFKLLSYPDKIFTRRQIMDEIWTLESDTDERTVDVHINRLRERFRDNEDFEIVTIRGLGYKAIQGK